MYELRASNKYINFTIIYVFITIIYEEGFRLVPIIGTIMKSKEEVVVEFLKIPHFESLIILVSVLCLYINSLTFSY